MPRAAIRLPRTAQAFVRRYPSMRYPVRRVHGWMNERRLSLATLAPEDIGRFLKRPFRKSIGPKTRRAYRYQVLRYLTWLHQRGQLSFDPECLRALPKWLPALAEEFLVSLHPTHRPSTWRGYRTGLRRFHGWLRTHDIGLHALRRPHMASWLLSLSDRGLHPSSRLSTLNQVRVYLRWLQERGVLRADPDDLIRRTDRPKLPTYLPRPLPPDVDIILQERLAASEDLLAHGLLLMRRTGLRVGELIGLEFDCVRTDHTGHRFLKVPLGKLYTERLVPLDDRTHDLVQQLRRRGRRRRRWLLESSSGRKTSYELYRQTLRAACHGLDTAGPMMTHRLRHTYATALLSGGMSLLGVMKLLGHRDYRMTLRYTAITQETVGREYFEALAHIESRYQLPVSASTTSDFDPGKLVSDLIHWTHTHAADRRLARRLRKRLERIQADLARLTNEQP